MIQSDPGAAGSGDDPSEAPDATDAPDAPAQPLQGIRVVELAGIGPAPFVCQLLTGLGAQVLRLERAGGSLSDGQDRGRDRIQVDLKSDAGRELVLGLCARADVLVEGLRPGATERLGLGPQQCQQVNPGLVYARMTGWGQHGPMAQMAGHDINYASITGALHLAGPTERPMLPANLVADLGGGAMFCLAGVLAALVERGHTGRGRVVDAAMVDGTAALTGMVHSMLRAGQWRDERRANLIDGGAPFYDTYRCSDGRFVAVGALEPQFFAALVAGLGVEVTTDQLDRSGWPAMRELFTETFASRTRDEWARHFAGTDACLTPVLDLTEAPEAEHLTARGVFAETGGVRLPTSAPRFDDHPPAAAGERRPVHPEVLEQWGLPAEQVARLLDDGVLTTG